MHRQRGAPIPVRISGVSRRPAPTPPATLTNIANAGLPSAYRADPLVVGRYFYSIPEEFLKAVMSELGEPAFEADALARERILSAAAGPASGHHVGWFDGRPIQYPFLDAPPLIFGGDSRPLISRLAEQLAKPLRAAFRRAHGRAGAGVAERRANEALLNASGYCGWLLTNRKFLDRHDRLVRSHLEQVRRLGLRPRPRPNATQRQALGLSPADDAETSYGKALRKFCNQWELAGLAGPYLPIPLLPQVGVPAAPLGSRPTGAGGTLIYWPNSARLPERDELRWMIENALRWRKPPKRLAEWTSIVEADTVSHKITRYARLLVVQHYLKTLHRRHTSIFEGNLDRLHHALDASLYPGGRGGDYREPHAVKKDMSLITKRLGGRSWYQDAGVLDVL